MSFLTRMFLRILVTSIAVFSFNQQAHASEKLAGDYFQACNGNHEGDFYEQHLNFLNDTIKWKFISYEDESCKTPYLIFLREYKNLADDHSEITTAFEKASYVSLTDEVTKSLNMIHYCGLNNWKTHVARDVTGLKCDDYQQRQLGEKESFQYSSTESQLYWNDDQIGYLKQD